MRHIIALPAQLVLLHELPLMIRAVQKSFPPPPSRHHWLVVLQLVQLGPQCVSSPAVEQLKQTLPMPQ